MSNDNLTFLSCGKSRRNFEDKRQILEMTGHHAVALLVMAEGEANSEAGKAKLFTSLLCSCLNLLLWVTEGLSGTC